MARLHVNDDEFDVDEIVVGASEECRSLASRATRPLDCGIGWRDKGRTNFVTKLAPYEAYIAGFPSFRPVRLALRIVARE
jgi:hypothetical protein